MTCGASVAAPPQALRTNAPNNASKGSIAIRDFISSSIDDSDIGVIQVTNMRWEMFLKS